MSAHVKVYRYSRVLQKTPWDFRCLVDERCNESDDCWPPFPTHAEALAAAWAHIKEHS